MQSVPLPVDPSKQLRFLIHFLPMATRTNPGGRSDDLLPALLAPDLRGVARDPSQGTVMYHPEDLSRVFVSTDGKT